MLGVLLWGLWIGLWRVFELPVVLGGGVLFVLPFALVLSGKLTLAQPLSAWVRWDLWLGFLVLVALRVAQSVVVTGVSVITGRVRPCVVCVPVTVKSDVARLLLLWSITVTPGTIALLLEGDVLYVHCLCQPFRPGLPGLALSERLLGALWG